MSYSDDDFTKELEKRILATYPIKIDKVSRLLVKSILDGMIKDGYAGPMFHKEISTKISLDKTTGVLNITFDRLLPSQESVDILKQKG